MNVYAAIQQESSGRVYSILREDTLLYWLRSTPGCELQGPFLDVFELFEDLAQMEGRTASYWQEVFAHFYPDVSKAHAYAGLSV